MVVPRIYIVVNGILQVAGYDNDWTDRAVRWINTTTPWKAEKFEYTSGVITGRVLNWYRAIQLRKLCRRYNGARLYLVGHSNGADIICRAVRQCCGFVPEIHLIAAAAPTDFGPKGNGLNDALERGRVGKVILYQSRQDGTLAAAKKAAVILRLFFLSYPWLGLDGPENVRKDLRQRLYIITKDIFGHSTWFEPAQFASTMNLITGWQSPEHAAARRAADRSDTSDPSDPSKSPSDKAKTRRFTRGQSAVEYLAVLAFVALCAAAVLVWIRGWREAQLEPAVRRVGEVLQ